MVMNNFFDRLPETKGFSKIVSLIILAVFGISCSSSGSEAGISVSLLESPGPQLASKNARVSVTISGVKQSRQEWANSWRMVNQSAPELLEIFMRQSMGAQPDVAVEGRLPVGAILGRPSQQIAFKQSSLARFLIEVRLSSLVPNIEEAKNKQTGALDAAGRVVSSSVPYVATSAMPILGPLGSAIQFFDLLTGIPVTWDNAEQEGVVTIETSVIDLRNGRVLASFPTNASFFQKFKSVGKVDFISGSSRFLGSTPTEALRVACRDAAQKVVEALRQGGHL